MNREFLYLSIPSYMIAGWRAREKIFKRQVERKKEERERERERGRGMMTMKYVYLCIYVLFIDK